MLLSPLLVRAQFFLPLEVGRAPFVRISVDPTVSLKTFLQDANMYGFEATVDSEIKQNLFLVGGVGYTTTTLEGTNYAYNNSGMFGQIGADVNLTKYQNSKDRDIFFLGLHYGFATLSHEASDILMSNYWGDYSTEVPLEWYTASWVALSMGVKAEAAKNIFIGWTANTRFRTHLSSGEMIPYNIPGYGKNDSKVVFDISFFVSYAITMKPKKQPVNIEARD